MQMFNKVALALSFVFVAFCGTTFAQNKPVFKGAFKAERETFRASLQRACSTAFSKPLTAGTQDEWADAFGYMLLTHAHTTYFDSAVKVAIGQTPGKSAYFKTKLNALLLNEYPGTIPRVAPAVYQQSEILRDTSLLRNLLPGVPLLISLQHDNRDIPGKIAIRNASGYFVRNADSSIFSVPQFARSVNNLPYQFNEGNTPQGVYRFTGFGVSAGYFIGPTPNLQLSIPFEISPQKFLNGLSVRDTVWTEAVYEKLIPPSLRVFRNLYETFYAGRAGRNEIIAHGNTIDPVFSEGKPWYPFAPTAGCLSTMEIWDPVTGRTVVSGQELLVTKLKENGITSGYLLVINID